MNKKFLKTSFLQALGTVVYVALVAEIMTNAERVFGPMKTIAGPIAFLMLFLTSAAITGFLVIGRPIMLYLDSQKREAVELFAYTVGWLLLFTILALVLNIFISR